MDVDAAGRWREERGARDEARPRRQAHHVTLWAGFGASPRVAAHVRAAGQGEGERGPIGVRPADGRRRGPAAGRSGRVSPWRADGAGRPAGRLVSPSEGDVAKATRRCVTLGPRGAYGWKFEGGRAVRVGQGELSTSKVRLWNSLSAATLFCVWSQVFIHTVRDKRKTLYMLAGNVCLLMKRNRPEGCLEISALQISRLLPRWHQGHCL
ncbi:uncharacterized protein LOC103658604 [Ursus maritimus]|uniref:Uncharacterized protein LOC103658604 n=1 Tax=Ursus maritimus TaxID=29073 RepID=A0A8M1FDA6_URSMA|nr:uncharacterized protein LOC103658604 [Ursus maritimus]